MVMVVDNVDQETSLIQKIVKEVVYKIARISGMRVIIALRPTTYYQQFHHLQEFPNSIAYCGPSPVKIVECRLKMMIKGQIKFDPIIPNEIMDNLFEGINLIHDFLKRDKRLRKFFKSLSGFSVRKGLHLARNLIFTSVYDITKLKRNDISQFVLQRALITGSTETYTWCHENIVENIFQVQEHKIPCCFIKMRILRILKSGDMQCFRLGSLLELLESFGYPLELIVSAIDELKSPWKRLIWSDSVKGKFSSVEELVQYGQSTLHLSTIGYGYEKHLYKSYTYIREVMCDTIVDPREFGESWVVKSLINRMNLVMQFLKLLIKSDFDETSNFISDMGEDSYIKYLGSNLITLEILDSISKSIQTICYYNIDHVRGRQKLKEELQLFLKEYNYFYNERKNWILHNQVLIGLGN